MAKIWVEVCLISARGLRRTSSFWKLQWFAVAWIDPNNKYCTKIDASGNSNPVWKTKFATLVDDSNFQDMSLHVEVYSREPLFLRESLQGTATVALKEFLAKYSSDNSLDSSGPGKEEVGSYQLRRKSSSKPQGFIDVSIHISEDRGQPSSYYSGNEGGLSLTDHVSNIASPSASGRGPGQANPLQLRLAPRRNPENQSTDSFKYAQPPSCATSSYNPSDCRPSYPPPTVANYNPPHNPPPPPPPPPPPSNVGYVPTFLPNSDYINMPASARPGTSSARPGLAMGVGAGALAAGAVIFGDDFMSGFNIPASLPDPSLTISTDPPF